MNDHIAYHLVPEPWYRSQSADAPHFPELFDRERFVHLTHGIEPIVIVGNTYYRNDLRPYLLLTVDLSQITSEVHYEDLENQYPHLYGPIDRDAIVAVRRMIRQTDRTFLGVADEAGAGATGTG